MKKKILVFEATVLLFLLSMSTITVQADPSIIITDYELTPSVFLPGDEGTLRLTIKNAETTNTFTSTSTVSSTTTVKTDTIGATINKIWIEPAIHKEKMVRATLNYKDLGELAPGASFDISFKIVIDENISEGVYFPIVNVDIEKYEDIKYPIEVKVSNSTIDLISTQIPSKISISGATDIIFSVINNRETTINNVRVTPKLSNGIDIKPESVMIECLNAGSSQDVHFSLMPLEIGKSNLTFDTTYKNGLNEHKQTSNVTVNVVDTLDVAPIIYNIPSKIEVGEKTSIRLKIYNSKTEDISSVIVTPISEARLTPSQYYIGSMDADDLYSVSFDIDTSGLTVNQTYEIGFTVSFKQDGTTYETPAVKSSFTVVTNNGNGDEAAIFIGVLLVILIIGGFLTIRWRKKQQMKKLVSKQR